MRIHRHAPDRIVALALFFVTSALLALVHGFGVGQGLYRDVALFDMLTHFLGGIAAGAGVIWALLVLVDVRGISRQARFSAILAGVLLAALLWEMFELWAAMPQAANYPLDTAIDIAMGALGGAVSFFLLRRILAKK